MLGRIRREKHSTRRSPTSRWAYHPRLENCEQRVLLSFGPPITYNAGTSPAQAVVADLADRGVPDIVTTTINPLFGGVAVLRGNGDGTFQQPRPFFTNNGASALTVGDFNGDGIPDVVFVDPIQGIGTLLVGNGDGTFRAPTSFNVGPTPEFVTSADLTHSGHDDLIVANFATNQVSVVLSNGDGTFQAPVSYAVPSIAESIAVGDFTGSGVIDFVVAAEGGLGGATGIAVFLGDGHGGFHESSFLPINSFPESVAVGDFTGSGTLDLVAGTLAGGMVVFRGNGDGTFGPSQEVASGLPSIDVVATGDFTGAGHDDIVAINASTLPPTDPNLSIVLSDGAGSFEAPQTRTLGLTPSWINVADLNNDGFPDLIVTNHNNNAVSILLNDGQWGGEHARPPRSHSHRLDATLATGFRTVAPLSANPIPTPIVSSRPDLRVLTEAEAQALHVHADFLGAGPGLPDTMATVNSDSPSDAARLSISGDRSLDENFELPGRTAHECK